MKSDDQKNEGRQNIPHGPMSPRIRPARPVTAPMAAMVTRIRGKKEPPHERSFRGTDSPAVDIPTMRGMLERWQGSGRC